MLIGFFPSPDIRKYERNNERRVYYLIIIFRRFSSGRTGSAQGNSLISIRENGRASNVTRLLLNAWTDSLFTKIILVRYKCDPYFDKRCTNVHTHTHIHSYLRTHYKILCTLVWIHFFGSSLCGQKANYHENISLHKNRVSIYCYSTIFWPTVITVSLEKNRKKYIFRMYRTRLIFEHALRQFCIVCVCVYFVCVFFFFTFNSKL